MLNFGLKTLFAQSSEERFLGLLMMIESKQIFLGGFFCSMVTIVSTGSPPKAGFKLTSRISMGYLHVTMCGIDFASQVQLFFFPHLGVLIGQLAPSHIEKGSIEEQVRRIPPLQAIEIVKLYLDFCIWTPLDSKGCHIESTKVQSLHVQMQPIAIESKKLPIDCTIFVLL